MKLALRSPQYFNWYTPRLRVRNNLAWNFAIEWAKEFGAFCAQCFFFFAKCNVKTGGKYMKPMIRSCKFFTWIKFQPQAVLLLR